MRRYFTITGLTSLFVVAVTILAAVTPARATTPPQSAFFSTAALESYSTYQMSGDGDLWPSCWADDDNLYAANGDGDGLHIVVDALRHGREPHRRRPAQPHRNNVGHERGDELQRRRPRW